MSWTLSLILSTPAGAQSVLSPVDVMSFQRPEAWALKYFTSTMLLSGLEVPEALSPGAVKVGVEMGWVPALSPAQERVGFNGTKQEDLHKAPMMARPRVTVGLPWRFSAIVAFVPPVKTFGVSPRLLAVGLERPMYERGEWRLGWRAFGQVGTATSDYTCPVTVLAFAPGSPDNPYGCRAASSDVATLRYVGGEVSGARRIATLRGLTPHVALAVTYLNSVFQVDARTFDYLDRTRLETSGVTFAASGGASYPLTSRISVGIDAFYSPLTVQRGVGAPNTYEGLFNVRGLVSYRVR